MQAHPPGFNAVRELRLGRALVAEIVACAEEDSGIRLRGRPSHGAILTRRGAARARTEQKVVTSPTMNKLTLPWGFAAHLNPDQSVRQEYVQGTD